MPRAAKENIRAIDLGRISKDLITMLLYPSVLGTIFVNAFATPIAEYRIIFSTGHLTAELLIWSIIVHYVVDYIYTVYFNDYTPFAGLMDVIVIYLMFLSASSVDVKSGSTDLQSLSLYFMLSYLIFIVIDLHVMWSSRKFIKTVFVEATIGTIFLLEFWKGIIGGIGMAAVIFSFAILLYLLAPKPRLVMDEQKTAAGSKPNLL